MKILITGALGHIGSMLIRVLPKLIPSSEFIIVDSLMTQRYASLFNLPKNVNYKFINKDITKIDLNALIFGVDVVIHLAAITDATSSFNNAEEVERNNLTATQKVANACEINNVHLIALSSTSVYGDQAEMLNEGCSREQLQPQSPYAETKLKEEDYIIKLTKEGSLNACILRFGTIYGVSPGMRFHTAVNKFCWQAVMGEPITVWATAYEQKRPYLDLMDACNVIAHVIKKNIGGGGLYNVLTSNSTVSDVIRAIRKYVPNLEIEFVNNKIMNQMSYEVSNEKIIQTGYKFDGNLDVGIGETVKLLRNSNAN